MSQELIERLRIEAQIHAQEARTANATIAEIYQLCSGGKGEPGNWHGAEPVRALVAERDALAATLRQQAARVDEEARDRVAKAIADVIGHGMREKCYPHADAALEAALSAQPAPERQGEAESGIAYSLWGLIHNGKTAGDPHQGAKGTHMRSLIRQMVPHLIDLADLKGIKSQFDSGHAHTAAPVGVPDGMVGGCVSGYLPKSRAVEVKLDEAVPDWITNHSVAVRVLLAAAPSAPQGTQQGEVAARERLEEERDRLMNSFGHGAFADGRTRDRIAEIDAQLATTHPERK